MKGEFKRTALSLIIALGFFGVLFAILKWNFFVAVLLSMGVFFGVYLVYIPRKKFMDLDVLTSKLDADMIELYTQSINQLEDMEITSREISDIDVKTRIERLTETGYRIIRYINENPGALSRHQTFFRYYLKSADDIVSNFSKIEDIGVSPKAQVELKDNTINSLDLLNEVFLRQLDKYHESGLIEIKSERELLENTISMGDEYRRDR